MADNRRDQQRRGVRRTLALLLVFILLVLAGFVNKILRPQPMSAEDLLTHGAVLLSRPRALSPMVLQDDQGQPFTLDALRGQWTLLFFGYATCPDVCPVTLLTLGDWYRSLQDTPWAADTRVLMVSVDPARDTPEVLAQYTRYFHADFRGITGEFMDLRRFATELNVAFQKVPGGTATDYLMDHSAHLVLLNPYGDYHAFFKPTDYSGPLPGFEAARLKLTYDAIRRQWRHDGP